MVLCYDFGVLGPGVGIQILPLHPNLDGANPN